MRAHHLLCLLGFRGHGYSVNFVENFKKIRKKARQASSLIKVVAEEDDICKACPFVNKGCKDEVEPAKRDLAVISRLGIESFSVFKSRFIYRKIAESFKPRDLEVVCKDCQWLKKGWCVEGLKGLKSEVAV